NYNVVNKLATAADYTPPTNKGAGQTGSFTSSVTGDAEKGALQLSDVDEVMQMIYEEGGKATKLMTSPSNRRAFSARAQPAGASSSGATATGAGAGNVRRNIDDSGVLRQSVELYKSDFGDIMVVPNYIMGMSNPSDANYDD